jgi:hypothetical protein
LCCLCCWPARAKECRGKLQQMGVTGAQHNMADNSSDSISQIRHGVLRRVSSNEYPQLLLQLLGHIAAMAVRPAQCVQLHSTKCASTGLTTHLYIHE